MKRTIIHAVLLSGLCHSANAQYFADPIDIPNSFIAENYEVHDMIAFDYDNDEDLDIIFSTHDENSSYPAGKFLVAKNNGDGTFEEIAVAFSHGNNHYEMKLDDFDGDGQLELMTYANDDYCRRLHWFPETGNYSNGPELAYEACENALIQNWHPIDTNNDGLMDFLISNEDVGGVLIQDENHDFDLYGMNYPGWLNGIVSADVDGDNDLDVVTVGASGPPENILGVFVRENVGSGLMANPHFIGEFNVNMNKCDVVDFNGDGKDDIIAFIDETDQFVSFTDLETEGSGYNAFDIDLAFCEQLFAGPIDPTGEVRIVVRAYSGLFVYTPQENNVELTHYGNISEATDLVSMGDLNQDGRIDLFGFNSNNRNIVVHWNYFGEFGCTDPLACNYAYNATIDTGCEYGCAENSDVNSDGIVNVTDLLTILTALGCQGQLCEYDLNNDGIVNLNDLFLLLANFGN